MEKQHRLTEIRRRLEKALLPTQLEIEDQSHLHAGHAGARDGRGHYAVKLVADVFTGHSLIARHRMIYQALGEMMQSDIHALSIEARIETEK